MKRPFANASSGLSATDPRVKLLDTRMKKENFRPDALIEILHAAQNAYGYLPMPVLQHISNKLHIPPARVFSTVTFYHFFSLKSRGDHTCLVCTGTACYVKGAQQLLDAVEQSFGIKAGEVSADNKLGLQVARCIGACGLAPAVVIDEEVQAKTDGHQLVAIIHEKLEAL
ncbi:MAG: NAD(P)H-dependent oxidoreductase subunit E [Bacteroidetes bacterium]|jgi:NAD(P)-dependent nickel-iron dehydrogenase diaphorase component subunit HoxE|uniref:NAD(P)H-dependent oxidoreductase subunit E n=1 Tax=Phnomibacter sp. TaxID=2836217 RepID=UPI002FDCA325|nr:NAD(P)H-dependent oxidoreductase subunit E [Bacteroidota bacterium]